ncbi:hypothetical protein CDV26_07600 [Francisella halioticida]|uniref:MFS transporter n=1 Tax=Francisella halioticida TaxID=549298 RepID=A0ABN5AWL9_9GAMM|nr:hypothetical protein CDV26_07600 [Francisella halioticida]
MNTKVNNRDQIYILLLIIFFSVTGTSMPYAIFAPLFIHKNILFSFYSKKALYIGLGFTLAAYPFGQFLSAPTIGKFSD